MSSPTIDRAQLTEQLNELVRRQSTWTVLLHQAIAERLGLNATDHKCLDILSQSGALTAGQLAELTGLTTGAITGVIDRLEKVGYVRRAPDPHDRRRVIVEPVMETAMRDMGPLFEPMAHDFEALLAAYSDEQLAFLRDVFVQSITFAQRHIARLRETPTNGAAG